MGKNENSPAANVVTTDDKGLITLVMRGGQSGASIRALAADLEKRIDALRVQGKKVLVLTDIRSLQITQTSSEAHSESKKLLGLHVDAAAVIGNRGIIGLAMYLVRISGTSTRPRFFTSERKARAWLASAKRPKQLRSPVSLVVGITVGLIGISTLVGWYLNNPYLTRGLPSLRPMNPMAAVGLVVAGYGFVAYWFGRLRLLKQAGVFGIVLGTAALLPIDIDHILFGTKVMAAGAHTELADSAALCFIAIGLAPFTVGTKKLTVRIFQYALGSLILGLSLANIFGALYAYDLIYSLSSNFVMAFNLAVAFLVVGVGLVLLVLYRHVGNVLAGVTRIGWLVVVSLVFVQALTYGAWSQAIARNKNASSETFLSQASNLEANLDQHIQAYNNALYGFKGLFISSDYVDEGEFQSYYDSLNLNTTYPGLRTLSFIAKVQEKNLPAFTAQHRSDKSLHPAGNPDFTITAKSTAETHYIVTYVATSASATLGTDLGSTPSRLAAFQKAETSASTVASGTVEFAATATTPTQNGFFMTVPVVNKGGQTTIGFVNAVFSYQDLFAKVFPGRSLSDGLHVTITDTTDGTTVYTSAASRNDREQTSDVTFRQQAVQQVADHQWKVEVTAPASFSTTTRRVILPRGILVIGQAFSVLLVIIFVLQTRARRQGFELAETITKDLQQERNRAMANDQKSTAILSSIGDAVLAVDTHERITLFNPSAQRISGFSTAEALGKPVRDVLKFELVATGRPNYRFIQQALAGNLAAMANHTVLTRKDGQRIAVADSAAPIRDAHGRMLGAIIVFRDVSKEYELDQAKTEFVSLASHQLRTPLSAINWYAEMLLNGDAGKANKAQREYLKEIYEGNQRMTELVNSLLDVSRLEVGKLANDPVPTDLANVIGEVKKDLDTLIQTKPLVLTQKLSALPAVTADPKQLRMVVQNTMSNAVKYTPANGSVTVTLRRATPEDLAKAGLRADSPHWFLSVEDTGYGIPKAQQSKIFEKLFRADNVRALDVEGTGLGLYIVKEVVQKLGGRVWFESTESIGTTFYIVAPFKTKEHQ